MALTRSYRQRYLDYLRSEKWAKKRERTFKRQGRRCRACGSVKHLHVHHLTYDRFMREADRDLLVLCATCHRRVHTTHRADGGVLALVTQAVVNAVIEERGYVTKKSRRRR